MVKLSASTRAMLESWLRSFVYGSLLCWQLGETEPKELLAAGVLAVLPMLARWLNPNDTAFGRNA